MHRRWCSFGYDPDAFWHQTPRSFQSAMDGALDRFRREGQRDLAHAHTTASFVRATKLERLSRYLHPRVAKAGGSLLDRMRAIAARTADRG